MSDTTKPIYNPHPYSMLVEARIMFETGMGLVEDAKQEISSRERLFFERIERENK